MGTKLQFLRGRDKKVI